MVVTFRVGISKLTEEEAPVSAILNLSTPPAAMPRLLEPILNNPVSVSLEKV